MNDIPVIVITYNRPLHTAQVLEALRRHSIKNIYIFSDAPKTEHDVKGVSDTRSLIDEIHWTSPSVIYQKENIGLAKSIVNATNSVFEKYDRLILLEDDCVPQQYFFDYMFECLKRYESNDKIFGISGYTIPLPKRILASYPYDNYFFSRICSWGWATWKRAWNLHDNDLRKLLDVTLEKGIDLKQGGSDIPDYIDAMLQGNLKDVWTLSWQLTVLLHGGCYVYPPRTHIRNIGMDGSGVHGDMTAKYVSAAAQSRPVKFANDVFYDAGIVRTIRSFYDVPNAGGGVQLLIHKIRDFVRNHAG